VVQLQNCMMQMICHCCTTEYISYIELGIFQKVIVKCHGERYEREHFYYVHI